MRISDFGRYALNGCVAAALLAGCGGSQPPIGAPGAMPRRAATATQAAHGKSWMLPEAKREDLLYVETGALIRIFTYPGGKLVGTIKGGQSQEGICSDRDGNVYIVEDPVINEYAHGGTQPIRTIDAAFGTDWSCAVDQITGNLAVTNVGWIGQAPYLMVYPKASGTPITYTYAAITYGYECVYDDKGNLFVQGVNVKDGRYNLLEELRNGRSTLVNISLSTNVGDVNGPTGLQWDGKDVVIGDQAQDAYRFKIQGHAGTQVGQLTFNGASRVEQFWLQGRRMIVSDIKSGDVLLYDYPSGGDAVKTISTLAIAATVSLTPKLL